MFEGIVHQGDKRDNHVPLSKARIPLVSVVIPTRNRATLLSEALSSVIAQEGCGCIFDMEVIVIDDASSDATPTVAHHFPEVRYLTLNTRRGPSAARNAGIAISQGKYLAFLDDDDVWMPNRLKVQVPILEQQPEIGVVYGHGLVKTPDDRTVVWPEFGPSGWVFEDFLVRPEDSINIDTLLVRKDLLLRAGMFDEVIETMEHYDFALRLAHCCQWYFVEGPIALGRELKEGKHYRDVASGVNERCLPDIIERALRLLPDSPNSQLVRHRARTAVCSTIAEQRWHRKCETASYLLSELRARPWLINEVPIKQQVRKAIRRLATSSSDTLKAVSGFWRDLCSAVGPNHVVLPLKWGDVLAEAAEAVRWDSGEPFKAAYLAFVGLKMNPLSLNWRLTTTMANALLLCITRPVRLVLNAWNHRFRKALGGYD